MLNYYPYNNRKSEQYKIDELSTAINALRYSLKKVDFYEDLLLPFPNDQLDDSKNKFADIYEKISAYFPAALYSSEISNADKSHFYIQGSSSFSTPIKPCLFLDFDEAVLADQIRNIVNELSDNENIQVINLSKKLLVKLDLYNKSFDGIFLCDALTLIQEYKKHSSATIKEYVRKIIILRKKISNTAKRDMRQVYRCIIRFLFKNMDADDDNVLFQTRIEQTFHNLIYIYDGNKTHNKILKRYY